MNRYMEEAVASHVSLEEKGSPFGNSKAKFSSIAESNNNQSNGFECNICLDTVQDPVVTLCGHLFCWPCIYKWLKLQDISAKELEEQQQNRCPVCKAEVSCTSLIPLYGRGQTTQPTKDKDRDYGITIPRRPLAPAVQPNMSGSIDAASATLPTQPPYGQNFAFQSQPYYSRVLHHPEQVSPMVTLSGTTTSIICPIVGIVGEMVYGRHFGNLVTSLYAYPNSYHTAASSGRIRRHVQEAEKSLNRICFFLYCCIFLFLLLL